jgi:hypothetical protein
LCTDPRGIPGDLSSFAQLIADASLITRCELPYRYPNTTIILYSSINNELDFSLFRIARDIQPSKIMRDFGGLDFIVHDIQTFFCS